MSTITSDKKQTKTSKPTCERRTCRWSIPVGQVAAALEIGSVGLSITVPDKHGFAISKFYYVSYGSQAGEFILVQPEQDNESCRQYIVDLVSRPTYCQCNDYRFRRSIVDRECKHIEGLRAALLAAGINYTF